MDTTEKIIKGAKKASNIPLKTLAGVDTPLMQLLFATGYEAGNDPFFYTLPAAFTDMTNRYLKLYEKSPGKGFINYAIIGGGPKGGNPRYAPKN